jgi:hypothetical protein
LPVRRGIQADHARRPQAIEDADEREGAAQVVLQCPDALLGGAQVLAQAAGRGFVVVVPVVLLGVIAVVIVALVGVVAAVVMVGVAHGWPPISAANRR